MMKRIPKGTLKVTTSSLDDQEPHQRSSTSSSSKRGSSRSVSSFASPVRGTQSFPPLAAAALITPTSPPPSTSAAATHHHTFHFLRRPFGGGHGNGHGGSLKGGRRRNQAFQPPPQHEPQPTNKRSSGGTSDTGGSSSSNSNTSDGRNNNSGSSNSHRSGDMVPGLRLGIAAPPPLAILSATTLAEDDSVDSERSNNSSSPIPSLDGNDTDSSDGGLGLVGAPTLVLPSSGTAPDTEGIIEASPPPPPSKAPRSPATESDSPAVLGIQRPNYYGCDADHRLNDSHDDDSHRWGDVELEDEEEESEIVFETDPIDAAETSTLFEQSWLSETGDLHPVASPSLNSIPLGSPPPPSKTTLEKARPSRRASRFATRILPPPSTSSVPRASVDATAAPTTTTSSLNARTQPPSTTLPTKTGSSGRSLPPSPILRSPAASLPAPLLSDSVRVFVLLLQPHNKVFELIQLTYPVDTTTIGDILAMIPPHATEPILAAQNYVGLTRPKKRAPDWCDAALPASYSAQINTHSAGFEDGNVIVALPQGYAHAELVRLAKKILANDRIRSLLERSALSSSSGRTAATKRHHHSERSRHSKHRHRTTSTNYEGDRNPHHSDSAASTSESPATSGSDDTEQRRRTLAPPTPLTTLGHVAASRAAYEAGIQRAVAHASRANAAVVRQIPAKAPNAPQDANTARRPHRTVTSSTSRTAPSSTNATNVDAQQSQLPSSSSSSATASVSSTSQSTATTSALRRRDHHATFQEAFASIASPALSRTRSMRRPHLSEATQPQRQPPFLEPSSSSTSVSSSVSSLSAVQRARNSPHKKPIFKATPKSLLDSEASDAASGDGSTAHSQWSRRRTGPQGSATVTSHSRPPHRRSFAPLSLSHSRASVHPSRSKRPRSAAAAASLGRAAALLALTMVVRYYTDPHGYAASQLLHQEQNTGWAVDPLEAYDRPLGLLGGLQLFLLLHLLLKFQQGYPGGGASSGTATTSSSSPPPSPSWQRPTRRNPSSTASVGSRSLCV